MTNSKISVVYITGYGHSGSTLLDRILGTCPDFFSTGELCNLWSTLADKEARCSCNQTLNDCGLWRAVLADLRNECSEELHDIESLFRFLLCKRHLPTLLWTELQSRCYRENYHKLLRVLACLYAAIAKASQSQVIIDSSKNPFYALMLSQLPNVSLHIIHLVRDSRAVSYSQIRKARKKANIEKTSSSECLRVVRNALSWNFYNVMPRMLLPKETPYMRVQFQDLALHPGETLRKILKHFQFDQSAVQHFETTLPGKRICLQPGHLVAGNRMRFKHGAIDLIADAEWQSSMNYRYKLLVQFLTCPIYLWFKFLNSINRHQTT